VNAVRSSASEHNAVAGLWSTSASREPISEQWIQLRSATAWACASAKFRRRKIRSLSQHSTHTEVSVEYLDCQETAIIDDGGGSVLRSKRGPIEVRGAVEECDGGVGHGHFNGRCWLCGGKLGKSSEQRTLFIKLPVGKYNKRNYNRLLEDGTRFVALRSDK